MRAWRFPLVLLACLASVPAWGEAPETSPHPRPRPVAGIEAAVTQAMTTPRARPDGSMTIAEAAAVEQEAAVQAAIARQQAEAARLAAEQAAAQQLAAETAAVEAIAEAQEDGSISPLAVPRSAFPQRRRDTVVQRYAALRLQRARAQEQAQQAAQQAGTTPQRSGGPSGRGLCGVPGLEGRQIPRVTSSTRGCGIEEPVSVTSVQGIPLSMAATLDCPTATALDRWIRTEALPQIGRTGGGVTQIRVAAHYACRTRNNQRGARISEHGRGRAIDISGFRLANGETVTVLQHFRRGPFSRAMQAMYAGACGIFGTTLGPNADRFHQDHFHFDTARYRGGSYCR